MSRSPRSDAAPSSVARDALVVRGWVTTSVGVTRLVRVSLFAALALFTLLVCAGLVGPHRAVRAVTPVGFAFAPLASDHDVRCASTPEPARSWAEDSDGPGLDVGDVELDDDEGDARHDFAGAPCVAVRGLPDLAGGRRPARGEPRFDTSRFAMGTGLPRGPPA